MLKKLKTFFKNIFLKIKLTKINFLNHKFKKYIINYEIIDDKIKIYNSNGDSRLVKNTVSNKVKIMEIVKEHKKEIIERIKKYEENREDYILFIISGLILILGSSIVFLFSFFIGSYIFLILSLLAFVASISFFANNFYRIMLFREEVKRLNYFLENNELVLDSKELKELMKDLHTLVKDKRYDATLKVVSLFDKNFNKSEV